MVEVWKTHPIFANYEISDFGSVRSLPRTVRCRGGKTRVSPGKIFRCNSKPDGYVDVVLCVNGKRHECRVSRLVLETFVGLAPTGMVARHLDGSRANNRVGNLAWGTPAENSADMVAHGTAARGDRNGMRLHPNSTSKGEKNGSARITARHVLYARKLLECNFTVRDVMEELGISKTQAFRIKNRESWAHI